ncbi:MAG: YeeE/YedE family protein [Polaromonas sp.]
MHHFIQPVMGGLLIGLASWLLLASLGRIAGISGIASGVLVPAKGDTGWRLAFITALVLAGTVTAYVLQTPINPLRPVWLLLAAGLLVGFGTVLGSGCTSGHGVCGLGRRSGRSLVATLVFMGTGVATVLAVRLAGVQAG